MMPTQTRKQKAALAANARKSLASKPKGHRSKLREARKAKMGPILRDRTYSSEKLMELAGWSRGAWRKAIKSGLESAKHGLTTYVTGEAYFRWIEERAKAARQSRHGG